MKFSIGKPFLRSCGNFRTSEEIGVEEASSTPVEWNKFAAYVLIMVLFFSIQCSTHGVEKLYSKILIRNRVGEGKIVSTFVQTLPFKITGFPWTGEGVLIGLHTDPVNIPTSGEIRDQWNGPFAVKQFRDVSLHPPTKLLT